MCFRPVLLALLFSQALTFLDPLPAIASDPSGTRSHSPSWTIGDSWELDLQVYSRYRSPEPTTTAQPKYHYRVTVRVAGTESVEGIRCWRLDYSPSSDAPSHLQGITRVYVREEGGWVQQLVRNDDSLHDLFMKIADKSLLFEPPIGLPAELYCFGEPRVELREAGKPYWSRLTCRDVLKAQVVEAFLFNGSLPQVTVKQVWVPGEKFWREYERYYKGRLDLRVKVPPESIASLRQADTGLPLTVWLARHPPGSDVDAEGLHDDPRLRVPLEAAMNSTTVPELLARLQDVSHLTMTSEPATPPPVSVFGSTHFHGTAAYVVMQRMAASGPSKGRWQTTADGYHLLLDDPTVAEPTPTPPAKRQRRPPLRFWLSLGGMGASIFVMLLMVWLRSGRDKQTPSAGTQAGGQDQAPHSPPDAPGP